MYQKCDVFQSLLLTLWIFIYLETACFFKTNSIFDILWKNHKLLGRDGILKMELLLTKLRLKLSYFYVKTIV